MLKKSIERIEQERIKLFGKPTVFYKAPFISKPNFSHLAEPLISKVLINDKNRDTVSVQDPFKLTFSFAPNYVSAVLNIYIDLDHNGTISSNDFKLVENGLVIDNDDFDEDRATGSYMYVFTSQSGFSSMLSTLIFEVNDFQSASSAYLTVNQEFEDAVILGKVEPPIKNLLVEVKSTSFDEIYVFTDLLGKFAINIDRSLIQQVYLKPLDLFGVMNGYTYPNENLLIEINSDTTEATFFYSPATSFIEGYVRDQYGLGVKNAQIRAYENNYDRTIFTNTDSVGHYKLGTNQGEYVISASARVWEYLEDNKSETVYLPETGIVQQDFTILKANSTISGKVTLNSSGIGGISIYADAYYNSLYSIVLSSSNGYYEIPVYTSSNEELTYTVTAYITQGYLVSAPEKTNVLPGTTDVNFEIKRVTGGLEGRITDNLTGDPISGSFIRAFSYEFPNSKYSNDSGYYRMSLPNGVYSLEVSANGYHPYLEYPLNITGGVRIKNITLMKSGSFSGSIKDEDGNPINQAVIMAIDTFGYPIGYDGYPDQSGNYVVSQLTTSKYGAYATASFGENNVYMSQWYDKVNNKDSATFFQVIEGYDTPNINFILEKGGSISGRAVDKFGNGIAGVSIDVFDTLFNQKSYAITNDSGYYIAEGLATGKYLVRSSSYEYIEQWYDGATSFENATKVSVVVKQTTPNKNFILSSGASISGTIKDKQNNVIPGAGITITDSTFLPTNYSYADNEGIYIAPKLQANKAYYIMAESYGYARQWYNLVSSSDSATPIILLNEEKRENIDFVLHNAGSISGRVYDNFGNPLSYIDVNLEDSIGNWAGYGSTDLEGYYSITNLSKGEYFARTYDFNEIYVEQWFDQKNSRSEADQITVIEGSITENINFNLYKNQNDTILIKLELVNIPDTLIFSQSYVNDYWVDYSWGINLDVDGFNSTGMNGYEIEITILHYKQPGELPFVSNLLDACHTELIEWSGLNGEVRHHNFNFYIDKSNKNLLMIPVPKSWLELTGISKNTKFSSNTYYLASNETFQDFTSSGYGGNTISDEIGDVTYDFIDIVSTSWEAKSVISVQSANEKPNIYSLSQNYPNPFNPITTIRYQIPVNKHVTIKVYDVLGKEVATLIDEFKPAGIHKVEFNASQLVSGVYFYKLIAGKYIDVKKMILLH
ncbi:MAG: carboxypeptidase regulatory-like domain-containing protein [Ignavibacteriales bacterium]|nr:carboxypeptidase regulatory-like domain-containing protein [Ignavibacteriales bacterium]